MIPDLVDNLRSLISIQYAEADRAICGQENFFLSPTPQRHHLAIANWRSMTEQQWLLVRHTIYRLVHCMAAGTMLSTQWWRAAGVKHLC